MTNSIPPAMNPAAVPSATEGVAPVAQPTALPQTQPVAQPTALPQTQPVAQPTALPQTQPVAQTAPAQQPAQFSPFSGADEEQVNNKSNLPEGRYAVVLGQFELKTSQNKANGTQGDQIGLITAKVLQDKSQTPQVPAGAQADVHKFIKRGFYQTFKPLLACVLGIADPNQITQSHFERLMREPRALEGVVIEYTLGAGQSQKGTFKTFDNFVLISEQEADQIVTAIPELQRVRPVGAREGWPTVQQLLVG